MNLHTRSICDACHDALATIEGKHGDWFCALCESSFIEFSVSPESPPPGVNVAAIARILPDAAVATTSSFDPEIEPFVTAHEAVWARDRKKAVTLRVTASRRIHASSASVSIPST